MRYTGEYGGRVLRAFKGNVPYIVGALIDPEVAMSWPPANRKALESQHKVEWFGPPVEEAPQKPAPKNTKKVEEKEIVESDEVDAGDEESAEDEEVVVEKKKSAPKKKATRRKR